MNIRFYNAMIMPMENGAEIISGEVWVQGDSVTYVGGAKEHNEKQYDDIFERQIDLKYNLIMPTFKNAHTHSAMTFLRSYADDLPLQQWLFDRVFPMEAKLTSEHIYHLTRLAYLEYLTSGIGGCFDMYFHPEGVAKAAEEMGMRTVMCGSVSGEAENAANLEELYNRYKDYGEFVSYRLGFHAEYTAEPGLMKGVASLSEKYAAPVFTHSSETKKEVEECIERYSMTPTKLFYTMGLMNYGGAHFHCVHTNDEDLALLKEKNVFAVINSGSNAKLASGIAPVIKMQNVGVNLAMGTDGPASNNCLDMFKEMFLTTSLQKLAENKAEVMDANNVLQMATVGGAHCMGLDMCDTVSVGKKADLIVIDLHQPNMQPINNISKNIVYSGSKQNVKMTVINGEILYEDNKFTCVDCEEIYYNANRIIESMR